MFYGNRVILDFQLLYHWYSYAVLLDNMLMTFPFYEFEKDFNGFIESELFRISTALMQF